MRTGPVLLLKRAPRARHQRDQPPGAGRASYSLHDEDGHVHVWDVDVGDVATRGDHEAAGQNGERHGGRCDGDERRARAEHLVGVRVLREQQGEGEGQGQGQGQG